MFRAVKGKVNVMKKTYFVKLFCSVMILCFSAVQLCSCSSKEQVRDADNGMYAYDSAPMEYMTEEVYYESDSITSGSYEKAEAEEAYRDGAQSVTTSSSESPEIQSGRKIIYSSSYDIETKTFDESVEALNGLCAKYGAYFESSNTYAYGGSARNANFRVRIPVKNYNSFVGEAGSIGVVIRSSQDNRDITEQYFDTEARLESAMIREERVLEILKNSAMLDDVLALERELADIRYEIESYTGTLRKYDSLVNYATVEINLSEVKEYVAPKVATVTFGERMSSSFKDGINEFKLGLQDLLVFLSYNFIGVIVWMIVIVILVIVVRYIVKKLRRAMKEEEKRIDAIKSSDGNSEHNDDINK